MSGERNRRRPASSLAMIPERSLDQRAEPRDQSESPRSRLRSVSANPESSRNTRRGLLPDLNDSPSPSPRKRAAAHAPLESPSKKPHAAAHQPASSRGKPRRPVPASVYAHCQA
jgi:hypothetical protein